MYVKLSSSGLSIKYTFVEKSLGVEFDSALKMDRHVRVACHPSVVDFTTTYTVELVSDLFVDARACEHAVRAIVLYRLDYANLLLYGSMGSSHHKYSVSRRFRIADQS